ncbi:MAG: UvrD-helicase domain-containing protein, partial [Patescibacteria group bacterium]
MVTSPILKGLNEKQQEAVKTIDGPVLVISGPGSGKTRCLTHRVAWLIASGIKPENILAITFTNKASGEMKERISKLLGKKGEGMAPTIGTFHSLGLRILRKEIYVLGSYSSNFSICGSDDQLSLMKRIMGNLEMDPKRYNPRSMLSKISKLKTSLTWPEDYYPTEYVDKIVAKLYGHYQTELRAMNALDFDDLIVLTVKVFREHPEILTKYHEWWKYIMVDEYQDTSHDLYQFVQLLASKYKNIFAIG